MIYLDNNATTFIREDIVALMHNIQAIPYNASSTHGYGRKARKMIEEARYKIKKSLGDEKLDKYRLIFTSSGTEANNLVIQNYKDSHTILLSAIEHASVLKPSQMNDNFKIINVNEQGLVDLEFLEEQLVSISGNKIVSIMFANNETGVIQNIKDISGLAHKYHSIVHCDAIQAFGKEKFDINNLDVDMMTISAHKCGGPLGVACLLVKSEINLKSILKGGEQEYGIRAGTENIAAIVGFGKAAEYIDDNIKQMQLIRNLRDYIEDSLLSYTQDIYIASKQVPRIANTSCIVMPNVPSETQLIHFDLAGIAISNGAACTSGRMAKSHVLMALGLPDQLSSCAIRVSLGFHNNLNEVDTFIKEWKVLYNRSNSNNKLK